MNMRGQLFEDDPKYKYCVDRIGDVAEELVEIFDVSESTQAIYILDVYLKAEVLIALDNYARQEPTSHNRDIKIQDHMWALLLLDFAQSMQAGEIRIISSEEGIHKTNNWLWSEHSENDEYPRLKGSIFENANIPGEEIKVSLTALCWQHNRGKGYYNRGTKRYFPKDLHDRFIIIDDRGWHLGGSLNDIWEKDLIVSEMDHDLAIKCKSRYNHIWIICSGLKENKNDK